MVTVEEFGLIHSLFMEILERRFERPAPIPDAVQKLLHAGDSSAEDQPLSEATVAWLDLVDAAIRPHQLRHYGQEHRLAEPVTIALLRFWAARETPSAEDREKVDWLVTFFFKARAEENKQPVGWVKSELQTLLKGISFPPLRPEAQSFLGELPPLLDDVRYLDNFSQINGLRLLERGRELKALLERDFCNPVVLAAVVNYNLVLGKRFGALLDRALAEAEQAGKTPPVVNPHQLAESLHKDYHTNTLVIEQLGDLTRKQVLQEVTEIPAGPDLLLDQQLKRLGIDSEHEKGKLRGRIRDLATKLQAAPSVRSLRICGSSLSLSDWEADALRSLTSKRDENLQGAFARSASRAVAFLIRIYEELYAYETKKGAGDADWRKHHNALFYLLYEGRTHKTALLQLSLLHRKSEFPELAQQLATTANKLEANLARLEDLF